MPFSQAGREQTQHEWNDNYLRTCKGGNVKQWSRAQLEAEYEAIKTAYHQVCQSALKDRLELQLLKSRIEKQQAFRDFLHEPLTRTQ